MADRNRNRGRAPLGGAAPASEPVWAPLPSALDGRKYEIRDSGGVGRSAYVARDSEGRGLMQVPLSDSPAARRTRLHEMAHVRWTPADPSAVPADVPFATLNAVEDARVTKRLREVGLDLASQAAVVREEQWGRWTDDFHRHIDGDRSTPWQPIDTARMLTATLGTFEEDRFRNLIDGFGQGWIAPVVDGMFDRHFGSRRPAFKRTVEFAVELERTFAELDDALESSGLGGVLGEFGEGPDVPWGTLTGVVEMPLPHRLPRGLRTRVRRSSDSGAVPRNWHRLPVDQRVFSIRRHRPQGGTVLIDQSGSMALSTDDVQAIMAAFPAVTIATYAGNPGADTGTVQVIARNGQRAADEDLHHPYGGNVIDGPALDWLADQPAPRFWVSDGVVTGKGDQICGALILDAARKCQAGSIARVDRLGTLVPTD